MKLYRSVILMKNNNIDRRKFLELFGCGCCSIIISSCTTVPITERKQLTLLSESYINRQAAALYENVKNKTLSAIAVPLSLF